MPVASYNDGVEELYGILNQAWQDAQGTVGYIPEIRWPGVQNPSLEPEDKYWLRPSFQTVESAQSSLQSVNARETTVGLFLITVNCPKVDNDPIGTGRLLAKLIKNAFKQQSTTGSIWFRRQTIKELPALTNHYPILVSVTTEWLEIR